MDHGYDFRRRTKRNKGRLHLALVFSVVMHVTGWAIVAQTRQRAPKPPIPITYEVRFVAETPPEPVEPEPEEPTPPEPEPEPPKPEPKPEPPPEPKKEEPIVVAKEPKPEPKPQPPKKPEPPKPKPEVEKPPPPKETGAKIQRELPSILNAWGRLVQRKVEKYWTVPGGLRIREDSDEALISFWVNRDGILIGRPEIMKHGSDKALAESGVRAILRAAPLPPLPPEYGEEEQQVVYAFTLAK